VFLLLSIDIGSIGFGRSFNLLPFLLGTYEAVNQTGVFFDR